jgi:predicted transcriptional regulator of viral defense system
MKIKDIWWRLVYEDVQIASTEELKHLCDLAGHRYSRAVNYLQSEGYIDTVFRGTFYIRTPEEVQLGYINRPVDEVIALGLEKKGISNWYFGLETALKYNHMTHVYFDITFIITDSYRTTKTVVMLGKRLRYIRWKPAMFDFGIIEKGLIRYSDPEKTLLDLAYRSSTNGQDPRMILDDVVEDYTRYDKATARDYLQWYPKSIQKVLKWGI